MIVFKVGDLIVDNGNSGFKNFGVGLIIKKKSGDYVTEYEIDFPALLKHQFWFENELTTEVGIGNFHYYPVRSP